MPTRLERHPPCPLTGAGVEVESSVVIREGSVVGFLVGLVRWPYTVVASKQTATIVKCFIHIIAAVFPQLLLLLTATGSLLY